MSRKLRALEMEAAGAISAVDSLPTLVVRGLSDAASNKGADSDPGEQATRQYAAENAARALVELLQFLPLRARFPSFAIIIGGYAIALFAPASRAIRAAALMISG